MNTKQEKIRAIKTFIEHLNDKNTGTIFSNGILPDSLSIDHGILTDAALMLNAYRKELANHGTKK